MFRVKYGISCKNINSIEFKINKSIETEKKIPEKTYNRFIRDSSNFYVQIYYNFQTAPAEKVRPV